jgi:hypothetical protein
VCGYRGCRARCDNPEKRAEGEGGEDGVARGEAEVHEDVCEGSEAGGSFYEVPMGALRGSGETGSRRCKVLQQQVLCLHK